MTLAPAANANDWMQLSCANPAGPTQGQGWSVATGVFTPPDATYSTSCAPGVPLSAALSTGQPAPVGSYENLEYTPPAGSTLVGGSVAVSLSADGYGSDGDGTDAWGQAALYTPTFASTTALECAAESLLLSPLSCVGSDYSGTVNLPANAGGNLYIGVGCGGSAGADCSEGGSNGGWAVAKVSAANLLLSNSSQPTGTGFAGTLLDPNAQGTATLTFTAGDPTGPGVYQVLVTIDGATVYDQTPNTNSGACVPAGTDPASGALMFYYQQPCLQSESVSVPVNTAQFAAGAHQLKVVVTDAAGNSAAVLDQTITIANQPSSLSLVASSPYTFTFDQATSGLHESVYHSYENSELTLTGKLESSSGTAAPGITVTAWTAPPNSPSFTKLASTTTDSAGHWALYTPKGASRVLRVVAAGAPPTNTSGIVTVTETVSPTVSLHVASYRHAKLVFSGKVAISPLGNPRALVRFEVHSASGWQEIGTPVRVSANGNYSYTYSGSTLVIGHTFAFRVTVPATSRWKLGISPVRHAVVR
ncbi:MAG: hypothetical protein ABSG64_08310 [Solirubrobacteraceae bacterium]|jgi:hypothetical protein